MQLAIITASHAPLRAEKSGASEMVSQLIFGEAIEILEESDTWLKVKNIYDGYTGWTDIRLTHSLNNFTDKELLLGKRSNPVILPVLRQDIYGLKVQMLGINSFFPDCLLQNEDDGVLTYILGSVSIDVGIDSLIYPKELSRENIIDAASDYLNTPYLWGGRSSLGIDCSGLVQMVFGTCGLKLERDARQQILRGTSVSFEEIKEGDVAFFANSEGKIIHTGICLGDGEIIHASGYVKTDELRPEGIFDLQLKKITHSFYGAKSYFTDCS